MENPEVEEILKFYRDIDLDIKMDYGLISELEEIYNTLEGVVYDGLPHGNSLPDQTAMSAVAIADTGTSMNIRTLKERINELEKLKIEILSEILSLSPVHKTIIYNFYIRNHKWEQIAERINYSVRQSKNIRCEALKILGKKFEKNKTISGSMVIKEII